MSNLTSFKDISDIKSCLERSVVDDVDDVSEGNDDSYEDIISNIIVDEDSESEEEVAFVPQITTVTRHGRTAGT
jgi:hypothetical protein